MHGLLNVKFVKNYSPDNDITSHQMSLNNTTVRTSNFTSPTLFLNKQVHKQQLTGKYFTAKQ